MKIKAQCAIALFLALTYVPALATPNKIPASALDNLIVGIAKKSNVGEDAVVTWMKKNEAMFNADIIARYEFGKGNLTQAEEDFLARTLNKSATLRLTFKVSDADMTRLMSTYEKVSSSATSLSITGKTTYNVTNKSTNNKIIELKDLFDEYGSLHVLTSEKINKLNVSLLKKTNSLKIEHRYSGRVENVNRNLASSILRETSNNPIAALHKTSKYDPEGGIGFCFGRAMTAHFESIYQGVSKDSIKKMWAVGDLRTGGTNWGWHVTTIVKTENTWLTIDPIFGRVLTIDEWYAEMKKFDFDGKMAIFFTDAPQFGPMSGKYSNDALLDSHYNGYFNELLEYYRKRFQR